jgi:RHS repeat-associated protein
LVKEVSQSTNNASTNLYVWGNDLSQTLQGAGGVGGLLCSITQASGLQPQAFYPCYDHNGNVEKVLTRSGAVVAAFQYDAFGNTIKETLASGLTPQAFSHRFSTKYFDSETGLYYYGYRYYSPEKGRWINRDPIGERGGMNLYGFVLNNPGNAYDRLGLETACCGDKSYNDEKQCCKNNEIKDLYDVSIHSYSSMKSHSWISAYNLSTGVKHTYGTRRADHVNPNEFAGGPNSDTIRDGLYVDYGREMNPPSSGFTTRTKKVCDFKPDPDPGYYLIGNNCTTYACNTWESNTGENLDTGLDSPDSLYDAINMALLGLWGDFSV